MRPAACLGGALLAACSGAPQEAASTPLTRDAGAEAAADAPLACTNGDVLCAGVCVQQSVDQCGPGCVQCPQPAPSHGLGDCFANQCEFACNGGYARCGTVSCCGTQTQGNVADIAVGGESTCAATKAGAVWCWGDGSYGVLGDGLTSGLSTVPSHVGGLTLAVRLALGDHHACALRSDGSVLCWGDDQQGQLGDGMLTPRGTPVAPVGLAKPIAAVAAGAAHTCALSGAGGVQCWGDNTYGQLGDSMGGGSSGQPVPVQGLSSGVAAVAAGSGFTCALVAGGAVECWGDGTRGQLGGPMSARTPIKLAMPASVAAIAAGSGHACALTSAGGVLCWGADDLGQLGSAQGAVQPVPVAVPGLAGIVALSAGGDETCALDAGGGVHCWGADPVGDVSTGASAPAVVPSLASGVARVAAVQGHACAVTTGGAPKCWGANHAGELGDGTMTTSWAPIDPLGI
jgi:alpha-tubulin suppressor-like RCC1 family protein